MLVLNLLVRVAYLEKQNAELQKSAQFKLFTLISQLQKTTLPDLKRGHCKENELWVMRVNKLTNKIMNDHMDETKEMDSEFDVNSLVKRHKKYIKNVEKTISCSRSEVAKA